VLGVPAMLKRSVTADEVTWIKESAQNYVRYARQYLGGPPKSPPGFQV